MSRCCLPVDPSSPSALNEQLLKFPHFTFQATFRSSSLRTTFYSPQATPRHLASLVASTFSVRQSATERLSGRGTQRLLLRKRNETVQPLVASPHVCTEGIRSTRKKTLAFLGGRDPLRDASTPVLVPFGASLSLTIPSLQRMPYSASFLEPPPPPRKLAWMMMDEPLRSLWQNRNIKFYRYDPGTRRAISQSSRFHQYGMIGEHLGKGEKRTVSGVASPLAQPWVRP